MDRIFITFEHSSTATSSELEDEQAAAEPLFRAMVKCLREKNVEILSGPFPWDSYGWAVEARSGPTAFTCMMQRSDGWLLQVFQTQSWLQRLLRHKNGSGLDRCAKAVADAVQQALDIPPPAIRNEIEFTNSTS